MEQELINEVLTQLATVLPTNAAWKVLKSTNQLLDGLVELTMQDQKLIFPVEYKTEVRNQHLPKLLSQKEQRENLLLVAGYIYPKVREELRTIGINYIETTGNVYLNNPPFYIFIDGHKKEAPKQELKTRVFTKTGLKVVFALLLKPELLNAPYRIIADETGVALDTVHNVINGLKELRFIRPTTDKQYLFENQRELFNRWMQEYDAKLKPDLLLGNYRFAKPDDLYTWKNITINAPATQWGAEPAADILTNYLRPAILTLYTDEPKIDVMKQLKLLPDKNGNVQLYKKFWQTNKDDHRPNVPDLLIYADLVNHGDPRNFEVAQKIDEQYLQNRFK